MYGWQMMERAVAQRVIGIVRTPDYESAVAATTTLITAGLQSVEITLTNPAALQAISEIRRRFPDTVVGVGSVLDSDSAVAAIRAGAQYLVSPTVSPTTIAAANRYGIPAVVGTNTPTEMLAALEAGASAVKLFPASSSSPKWVSDVRAALPQLPIIPTGGVTPETAADWIAAGAVAVGLGSALTKGTPEESASRVADLLRTLAAL